MLVGMLVVAACGGSIEERPAARSHDGSQRHAAIERFVNSGRTPDAFAQLASTFEGMRGADPVVALDAELRLLALAAPIVEHARSRTLNEQLDELALTVWPTLLSSPLTGAARPTVAPRNSESPRAYVARLCADELSCGSESPEVQAITVRAIALRNANERMHEALARCLHCASDGPEWHRRGWMLESLDRAAAHEQTRLARAARPVLGRL